MLFLLIDSMEIMEMMGATASAAESGVGVPQNQVDFVGARLSHSVTAYRSDLSPSSSLLTAFQTSGSFSLDTFLPRFDTQAGGPSLGPGGLGAGLPSQANEPFGLRIVPLVTMSERYDSNVFLAPKLPGLDRQDWVTKVFPRVFLQDSGRIIGTTVYAGTTGEYYAKNTELSYVSYNAGGSLNVTELLRRFVPEASLYFMGNYTYTPLPPAFLGGGGQTNPGVGEEITSQLPVNDTYTRGIQSQRVNTTSYFGGMSGSIRYSPNLYILGSYGYAVVSFGTPAVTQQAPGYVPVYNKTTAHSVSGGPLYKLTEQDSVNLYYQYVKVEFGADRGGYESHAATVGYQRTLAASFVGRIYGGASIFTRDAGGQQATTSANSEQQVSYTGGASLSWARRNTQATLAYTTGIYPNYTGIPGVALSSNLSLRVTQRLDDDVNAYVSLNYGENRAIGQQTGQAGSDFHSYITSEGLSYRLSSSLIASVIHDWLLSTGNYTGQEENKIIRNAVTISLTKAWY